MCTRSGTSARANLLLPGRAGRLLFAFVLLGTAPALSALEVFLAPVPGTDAEDAGSDTRESSLAAPHSPAKPSAYLIKWDKYRTLVVVDTSAGLLRPAWVVTYATMPEEIPTAAGKVIVVKDQVVVAYRGQAFNGRDGVLHIDCHRALIIGAAEGGWSPDSFDISVDLSVSTHDDVPDHPGNNGEVEKVMLPGQQGEEYRALLLLAQAIIEGNS